MTISHFLAKKMILRLLSCFIEPPCEKKVKSDKFRLRHFPLLSEFPHEICDRDETLN